MRAALGAVTLFACFHRWPANGPCNRCWICQVVKPEHHVARPMYDKIAITKDPTPDTLLNILAFNLSQADRLGARRQNAGFVQNAAISDPYLVEHVEQPKLPEVKPPVITGLGDNAFVMFQVFRDIAQLSKPFPSGTRSSSTNSPCSFKSGWNETFPETFPILQKSLDSDCHLDQRPVTPPSFQWRQRYW